MTFLCVFEKATYDMPIGCQTARVTICVTIDVQSGFGELNS